MAYSFDFYNAPQVCAVIALMVWVCTYFFPNNMGVFVALFFALVVAVLGYFFASTSALSEKKNDTEIHLGLIAMLVGAMMLRFPIVYEADPYSADLLSLGLIPFSMGGLLLCIAGLSMTSNEPMKLFVATPFTVSFSLTIVLIVFVGFAPFEGAVVIKLVRNLLFWSNIGVLILFFVGLIFLNKKFSHPLDNMIARESAEEEQIL